MPTRTANAIPGPKARNRSDRAITSAPVPAATVRPATATIGVTPAAAARAAERRSLVRVSSVRSAERKR
jgi:hypothetical protein